MLFSSGSWYPTSVARHSAGVDPFTDHEKSPLSLRT